MGSQGKRHSVSAVAEGRAYARLTSASKQIDAAVRVIGQIDPLWGRIWFC